MDNLLLIDEVQWGADWERLINSLHAQAWCDIVAPLWLWASVVYDARRRL